jgi:2-polyprenyl-6-hydroxyphenyl methylase/3-demethylubiquinone-9 3-methyltransferase
LAIYNDQGRKSQRWAWIKRTYNQRRWLRPWLLAYTLVRARGVTTLLDFKHLRPFASWRNYGIERGMSPWWDVVDWVGGYPFEVAKPEAVFDFFRAKGFVLTKLKTCGGGHGCNEFVFVKP